jgi:hypothetical protein
MSSMRRTSSQPTVRSASRILADLVVDVLGLGVFLAGLDPGLDDCIFRRDGEPGGVQLGHGDAAVGGELLADLEHWARLTSKLAAPAAAPLRRRLTAGAVRVRALAGLVVHGLSPPRVTALGCPAKGRRCAVVRPGLPPLERASEAM